MERYNFIRLFFFYFLLLIEVNCTLSTGVFPDDDEPTFKSTETIEFVGVAQAIKILSIQDDYTASLGLFNIQSKTENVNHSRVDDYLLTLEQEIKVWTNGEINTFIALFEKAIKSLADEGISLPFDKSPFLVINSGMKEENGLRYYVRKGHMICNPSKIDEKDIISAIFKIHLNSFPNIKDQIFEKIGFKKLPIELKFPDTKIDKFITLPSYYKHEYFIPIIQSSANGYIISNEAREKYVGGNFSAYNNPVIYFIDYNSDSGLLQLPSLGVIVSQPLTSIINTEPIKAFKGVNEISFYNPMEIVTVLFTIEVTDEEFVDGEELEDDLEDIAEDIVELFRKGTS